MKIFINLLNVFNKIINREIPADIIYETDNIIAFRDVNPVASTHILIIPKKDIPTINDIDSEDSQILSELLFAVKKIAKQMNIDKEGYRVVINCNDNGGQTVYHLHLHLIGGRKLNWPPG